MRNTWWMKVAPAAMIMGLVMVGCGHAAPTAPKTAATAAAKVKAPLQIPASFPSDKEKQAFAIQAVNDGYYKEAAPLLEDVLKANPTALASLQLGTARYNLKDYAGAIDAWSEAAQLDQKLAGEMKNNIGNALRDNGKMDEAVTAYRDALKADPTVWSAAINLSDVLRSQDKLDQAITVLEQAAKNNKGAAPLTAQLEAYKAQAKTKSAG